MNKLRGAQKSDTKPGFTVIEVMLVLAITGLMLVGILGGTYSSIATQRYNDSVRSFSEFLRQLYSEVISPQSLGDGNSDTDAVYGKIAVFGLNAGTPGAEDIVYTATLIGNPAPPPENTSGFIAELQSVTTKIFCGSGSQASTVDQYVPMWQAKIDTPSSTNPGIDENDTMSGSLIIVRSPATGVVHTAFSSSFKPDLKGSCQSGNPAITVLSATDPAIGDNGFKTGAVDFCIVSDNSRLVRDIRLAADGHNSSAISLIPVDEVDPVTKKSLSLCKQK